MGREGGEREVYGALAVRGGGGTSLLGNGGRKGEEGRGRGKKKKQEKKTKTKNKRKDCKRKEETEKNGTKNGKRKEKIKYE